MTGAALQAAIRETYGAFATLPCPRQLHASPLRDAEAILRALTSAPLAALPDAAIAPYSRWAITTVGTEADFRHFLPRILELAATDPNWTGAEPPLIADRIERAGWADWPIAERKPVADLFAAAFDESLERGIAGPVSPDDWLCGMALLGLDLVGSLARWRADSSGDAALALAVFVCGQSNGLRCGRAAEGYWETVPRATQERVGSWLASEARAAQLQAALTSLSPKDHWDIEQAVAVLAGLAGGN